ncbi:MAG: protein translocase subunit SecD [Verrucomicrobia bacterium]|jgi:SecD/SecF fusion protein|nr:protein translocase subunit SecD [Verrucomicrobiota bacterium]
MNRNSFWRWALVALLVAWALYELYPPAGRDLIEVFKRSAVRTDDTFSGIVTRAESLRQSNPDNAFGNLVEAIGTNDIRPYFPQFATSAELRPTAAILNRLQRQAAGQIKLGLDLQGGTSFLMEMDTNRLANAEELQSALPQAVEVLRRRVDVLGVSEPVIQPAGENRILVQLPGLSQSEKEEALRNIQKAAFLEFRLVHPQSERLLAEGALVPGYEVLQLKHRSQEGGERLESILVKRRPERGLTGQYVTSAFVTRGNLGEPKISFTFDSRGASIFAEITRENVGNRLAIILDGELYSAPVIRTEILGGSGEISGSFDAREAQELAQILLNPLRAPLVLVESREVDPSLGRDSIASGIKAVVIGLVAVSVFMLVYYLLAGLIANAALALNVVILLGVMCAIDTTLTLPGIAGIVLTIGMAVDANVLIFERVREELAAGKSMRGAVTAGYEKAFSTIFDSNVTTLISSIILWKMGVGPVKGFGVTLTIGVAVSMFTALFITRLFFEFLLARNLLKSLPMLHLVRASKLDFMKVAVPAFIASWILIIAGNSYGIFVRGKDALSVDFVGGDSFTLAFDQSARQRGEIEVDKIRATVDALGRGASQVQFQRDITSANESLRITVRAGGGEAAAGAARTETSELVRSALTQTFPTAQFELLSVDKVGPTVGKQIAKTAVVAALLSLFGILVYVAFRYEFSFAIGAVIAILHDLLMTSGWYFLAGREFNATTVAAFLTIIGFSINDTIVIFDRVREDLKLGVRGTFREVMNTALNQTLSRTIITSGTVFLATLALYLFGGGVINDFAFAFLVGILTGTYSSIYIACFIVLRWHKGQRPAIGGSPAPGPGPVPVQA